MTSPLAHSSSDTARLMTGALGFQVGWQQPLYLPNPAAGVNWSHTVDGRYSERVVAVSFTLTTSAVVTNRFPAVNVSDTNGKVITSVPAGGTVPASTSLFTFLAAGAPAYAFGNSGGTFGWIPDFLLPPGWTISSAVAAIDPGDQLSSVILLVQQFPNDVTSMPVGG